MIFDLIFQGRDTENIQKKITLLSKTIITWYEGDFQRSILLVCLVPMWVGLVLFFILLIPLIPNKYSGLFASIPWLTCILLVFFSYLGWTIGKKMSGIIPETGKYPRLSMVVFIIVVIGFLVLVFFSISLFFNTTGNVPGDMKIRPDQQYFSPHISSAKGLRLDIMNVSGSELVASRHIWSADYGYFINVMPSTSEVTILGNPVYDDDARDIYWTFSENDPEQNRKPVKIDLHLYSLQGNEEIASSSLYLTWYNNDIVYVNTSSGPLP